jgi:ankyrin repeat protein
LLVLESERYKEDFEQVLTLLLKHAKDSSLNSHPLLIQDNDGNTPLHLAIEFGDLELAKMLSKESPQDVWRIQNSDGLTPLALAAYNVFDTYQDSLLSSLLEHIYTNKLGKDVLNISDNQESTVLHHLAIYGNVSLIQKALECGADLELQNQSGKTPIMSAVRNDREKAVKFLKEKGAKLSNEKTTVLHEACKVGSFTMIQKFKDLKNEKDQNGLFPFDWAYEWVQNHLPGSPQDHLKEILETLDTGKWPIGKKTEFLIETKDFEGLYTVLNQPERPAEEIQKGIIEFMIKDKFDSIEEFKGFVKEPVRK